jgi:hypothetical protein
MSVGKACLSLELRLSDALMLSAHRIHSLCLGPLGADRQQHDVPPTSCPAMCNKVCMRSCSNCVYRSRGCRTLSTAGKTLEVAIDGIELCLGHVLPP